MIVEFKNRSLNLIRIASSVMHECRVQEILSDKFNNDIFPGYENVRLSWEELSAVIKKNNWVTALQNQKAVYLITNKSNGKMYVGSASGDNMLIGRWQSYVKNGHGNNVGLKDLCFEHIKNNFECSILDIFKSTKDDNLILKRGRLVTIKIEQYLYRF